MRVVLYTIFAILLSKSFAQADFTVSANGCREENIYLSDVSAGFESYSWDFCEGDLSEAPTNTLVGTFAGSVKASFETVFDGTNWYGFYTSFSSSNVTRLDFGNSLTNTPTAQILSIPSISQPYDIDIVNDGGNWYGFVASFGGSSLLRLEFGTDLSNISPTSNSVTITGTTLSQPRGLDIVLSDGVYYGLVGNNGATYVSFLTFDNGLTGDTSGEDIEIGSTGSLGVEFAADESNWYAYVNSTKMSKITFGPTLSASTPTAADMNLTSAITNGSHLKFFYDNGSYFLILGERSGNVTKVDLGSDLSLLDGTVTKYGGFGVFSDIISFGGVKDSSTYHFFAFSAFSNDLYTINFPLTCSGSLEVSSDMNPSPITYASSDNYNITLRATDSDGFVHHATKTVAISADIASDITFSISSERCIEVTNAFTSANTSGDIISYSWDFDGDGMEDSTDPNPSFQYALAGSYVVTLEVNNVSCSNTFQQAITVYDQPAPDFSIESPLCSNSSISFQNSTNEFGAGAIITYLWEFIDQPSGTVVGSATTEDAAFTFNTEGDKTIRLTAEIPGCQVVTEQNVNLAPGPTADFFAASVCQGEAMQFTNTSTDAVSYSWDFGDGFMSTAENPSHIFTDAGNFFVTLTSFNALGCADTETIEVAVSDSPQISFDFDIPCTSSTGIQFFDLTTVDNADLVSWTWFVDDVQVSTEQSPQIVFGSTGIKNIRLDVQSSNGCESSYSEDIDVLSSPVPDFNINLGCQGETSTFTDNTSSSGNPIVSWLWTVDGVNYGTQDINHVFSDAGTYEVMLEVTAQNFCSETITKSVEVIELPTVSFSVDGECNNQLIRAFDQSGNSVDPIIARRWMLDGANVGSGTQLVLSNLEESSYELALELETEAGCVISSSQMLEINIAPESSFTSSRTYGIPNDQLMFTNTSTGGIAYQWLLNDVVLSTDPTSQQITFSESGTYNVSLVTQNSLGCNDTTTQEILIAVPEVDLAIGSFELVSENNVGKIFLEVQNFSNLPVEVTEAQIVLENTFTVTEQITGFIGVGESTLVSLNIGIPLNVSEPSYFCVKLSSQYVDYNDVQPVNNEKCLTINPIITVEDPFPNPVTDQFRLKLVMNNESTASITLISSAGKMEISQIENVSAGLNNFFIDMSTLNPGIYYVIVDVQGTRHKRKVIKL